MTNREMIKKQVGEGNDTYNTIIDLYDDEWLDSESGIEPNEPPKNFATHFDMSESNFQSYVEEEEKWAEQSKVVEDDEFIPDETHEGFDNNLPDWSGNDDEYYSFDNNEHNPFENK
jgi:hypothetical protein